ncbi:hypothetical protein BBJ28_00007212 [Nothophytophthora sp. Chile5]|nr:hypothetical protein BBJ28_00007212 [Nothophytophthora sp. Chile5]
MNTLLHVAASSAGDKHCYYIIRCLHFIGNIAINTQNWEGKTPLHIAAEVGALGFCEVLIEKGASAGEECSAPDNRLLDQPSENPQYWKAINFAATVKTSLDEAQVSFEERSALVEYLLKEPDSLPDEKNALHDCKEKIQMHFPLLLPLYLRVEDGTKHKADYAEAEELYYKVSLLNYLWSGGPNSLHLPGFFYDCVLLRPMHSWPCSNVIFDEMPQNKQLKTALHVAVEHNMPDICLFLISHGADVTASCQNLKTPSKEVWHTPLYTALWSPTPKYEIIEILLSTSQSIARPRNPKLHRSERYEPGEGPEPKWNSVVLEQLMKVHASSLPLFLDHYAIEVNRINGEKVYRFIEVSDNSGAGACILVLTIVNPTGTLTPSLSSKKSLKNSAVGHPVVRNAIHLKWQLFGSRTHRKQLSLYVLMVTFFYLSNLLLPKIEVTTDSNGKKEESSHKWIEFDTPLDYFVGTTKICCWIMAIYHLVYVEFFKEWRSDPKRYWRSVWNLLDVFTYLLVLSTIPFEVYDGHDTQRECMLSVLSILLCVNLMQALLVSSYFSVLIFTFARMFRVVARFLFQYMLLLLGFSGGLFLLYHGTGPYADFFSAMRIVFLTTFGEINYGDSYSFDDSLHARNYLAFMLLTLYVLVVIVVAMNLLIALMTSEYEKVRAQAKELSLLELAGALHRYEQWIGRNVVRKLYSTPKGQALIDACVKHMPGATLKRRGFYRRELTSMSSSFSGAISTQSGRYDGLDSRQSKIDAMNLSLMGKANVEGLEVASVTEAIASQVMKRVHDEMAALRVQVTAELQEVKELLETAQRGDAQTQEHVATTLTQVLQLLTARGEGQGRS